MSQLEQILFKVYTDLKFRQNVQNGTEQLTELSEDERTAVKALNFNQADGPYDTDFWCEPR